MKIDNCFYSVIAEECQGNVKWEQEAKFADKILIPDPVWDEFEALLWFVKLILTNALQNFLIMLIRTHIKTILHFSTWFWSNMHKKLNLAVASFVLKNENPPKLTLDWAIFVTKVYDNRKAGKPKASN